MAEGSWALLGRWAPTGALVVALLAAMADDEHGYADTFRVAVVALVGRATLLLLLFQHADLSPRGVLACQAATMLGSGLMAVRFLVAANAQVRVARTVPMPTRPPSLPALA